MLRQMKNSYSKHHLTNLQFVFLYHTNNHLARRVNTRLSKIALNYQPRGRRDRGRPRQRIDARKGQTALSMEEDDDYITQNTNHNVCVKR
jgi:hypothetical protein